MSLASNVFYNSLYRIAQVLIPLISFPYVTRVLGPEKFGLFGMVNGLSGYFVILAGLGLQMYGIREVSSKKSEINNTFSALYYLSIINSVVAAFLYLVCVLFFDAFRENWSFYLVPLIVILTNFLSLDWFIAGIQQFKFISFRSIAVRLISLILIILLVKEPSDLFSYLCIVTISQLAINLSCLVFIRNRVTLVKVRISDIMRHYRPLFVVFSATFCISLSNMLDVVLLGYLVPKVVVGYYAVTAKVIRTFNLFVSSFNQVILSHLMKLTEGESRRTFVRRVLICLIAATSVMGIGLFAFPEIIVSVVGGDEYLGSIPSLRIMSALCVLNPINLAIGYLVLMPISMERHFSIGLICGTSLAFVLMYPLIMVWEEVGLVYAILLGELVTLFILIKASWRLI